MNSRFGYFTKDCDGQWQIRTPAFPGGIQDWLLKSFTELEEDNEAFTAICNRGRRNIPSMTEKQWHEQ